MQAVVEGLRHQRVIGHLALADDILQARHLVGEHACLLYTSGQATDQLWSFLPIYLGPVLLMLFAPWVLQKMIMISKQENITSIADFIAARYGKSQALAVVVALICMVGVLPYIALQLKGIVLGVNLDVYKRQTKYKLSNL